MLAERRPKFVFLNPYNVWGGWPWEEFGAGLDRTIRRDYVQVEPARFEGRLWERSTTGNGEWGASVTGPASRAVLERIEVVHPYGRFIEIGDGDRVSRFDASFLRVSGRIVDPPPSEGPV